MNPIKSSFQLSYKNRLILGVLSLLLCFFLIAIFRTTEDILIPISWLVVFLAILEIPFLFTKKEGMIFGCLLGLITMIVFPLGREDILYSFLNWESFNIFFYIIVVIIIVTAFTFIGYFLGSFRELLITEEEMTKALVSMEEKRSTFISIISHELRGPLTVIKGHCTFIKERISDLRTDQIKKRFKKVDESILRLEHLIGQISDVEQIQRGYFRLDKKPINFSSLLNDAISPFRSILKSQLVADLSKDENAIIYGDKDKLLQVFENIIRNAIKHTSEEHRTITITSKTFSNIVSVEITDNGAGISKENLKKIFTLFTSFPTKYGRGGSGIGLYLSRKIAEAHDGSLTAFSNGIGYGTTFTLTLPRYIPSNRAIYSIEETKDEIT